jgi:hypothetical protein
MSAAAPRNDTGGASGGADKRQRNRGLGSNYPLWRLDSLGKFSPPVVRELLLTETYLFCGSGFTARVAGATRAPEAVAAPRVCARCALAVRHRFVDPGDDLDR